MIAISPDSVKRSSKHARHVTMLPVGRGREWYSTVDGSSSSQRMYTLSLKQED